MENILVGRFLHTLKVIFKVFIGLNEVRGA